MKNSDKYDYVGSGLSIFPILNIYGEPNYVSGVEKISSEIITVLLIQPGEDPRHPGMGIPAKLFQNLSQISPSYWVSQATQQILTWVAGVERVSISLPDYSDVGSSIEPTVIFVPKRYDNQHSLTFGWYSYLGARFDRNGGDLKSFRESIALDGKPFFKEF